MAVNYWQRYRTGMGTSYGNTLADALRQARQAESLSGRFFTPEEHAAIVRGALAPYVQDYSAGAFRAGQLEQEQQRTDILKNQQQAQEEAAKMQGYTNIASLGLNAALTGAITKQAGLWGTPSTIVPPAIAPSPSVAAPAVAATTPMATAAAAPEVAGPLAQGWATTVPATTPAAAPSMAGPYAAAALAALSLGTQIPGLRDYYPQPYRHYLTQASKYGFGVPAAIATGGLSVPAVRRAIGSTVKKIGKKLGF